MSILLIGATGMPEDWVAVALLAVLALLAVGFTLMASHEETP